MTENIQSTDVLAASITKRASKQTYYTFRFLVDRGRVSDAYRAYAYFRWVDDQVDEAGMTLPERIAFIKRQADLIERCYRHEPAHDISIEERMLVELINSDQEQNSGLQSYIRNMMSVMAFDASRQGRLISQSELIEYAHTLSVAVTEALHYFIGHHSASPRGQARYLAVTAAHITHMLRDTLEDIETGYFNTPYEILDASHISLQDVTSSAYRTWVQSRVQLARDYFRAGKENIAQIENIRCRLAGYAYIARFEVVLDAIEQDKYQLRRSYPERKSLRGIIKMIWSTASAILDRHRLVNRKTSSEVHKASAKGLLGEK
jgi:phytoene/squalene synthetase